MGFLSGSDGKESACNAEDLGLIPELGRSSGGRHGNPFQYSCLENPDGQRRLAGYSPWGPKESDMTERLILNRDAIPDDLLGNSFKTFEQRFTSVKEGFLDILYCA